jgi:putative flippase GtrA
MLDRGHRSRTPARPAGRRQEPLWLKLARHAAVSSVATVLSQGVLVLCTLGLGLPPVLANTAGAVTSTPPAFQLNRRWAWGRTGKSHLHTEVVPFWGFSLLGWAASSVAVHRVVGALRHTHMSHAGRTASMMVASLLAYGLIWGLRFVVLDRLVFGRLAKDAV